MSKRYAKLPSELLSLSDEYTAFCFDEACAYIMAMLDDGKKIVKFVDDEPLVKAKHYSRASDMYKDLMESLNK